MGSNVREGGSSQWRASPDDAPAAALQRQRVWPVDAPSTPLVSVLCFIDKRRRRRCDSLTCSQRSILYSIRVALYLRLPLTARSFAPAAPCRPYPLSFATTTQHLLLSHSPRRKDSDNRPRNNNTAIVAIHIRSRSRRTSLFRRHRCSSPARLKHKTLHPHTLWLSCARHSGSIPNTYLSGQDPVPGHQPQFSAWNYKTTAPVALSLAR
ncbi:hypothetical protein IG631_08740 [Alternaria alternata]|nr:hypothetical protein IG631_08740 [Alternaria alternata]